MTLQPPERDQIGLPLYIFHRMFSNSNSQDPVLLLKNSRTQPTQPAQTVQMCYVMLFSSFFCCCRCRCCCLLLLVHPTPDASRPCLYANMANGYEEKEYLEINETLIIIFTAVLGERFLLSNKIHMNKLSFSRCMFT